MRTALLTIYGIGFFLGWALIGWVKEKFNQNSTTEYRKN